MATATVTTPVNQEPTRQELLQNIVKFVENEYNKGNSSVSAEKYEALLKYQREQEESINRSRTPKLGDVYIHERNDAFEAFGSSEELIPPPLPRPLYLPLFYKFHPPQVLDQPRKASAKNRHSSKPWTFRRIENAGLAIMETGANLLDNLHLLSRLPMFPQKLHRLLQHTNSIWVVILIFLIRKTISQLLNVLRRERKVKNEMAILNQKCHSPLLDLDSENGVLRRYRKALKDLKFDKMMLQLELIGNLLDLAFNAIELYKVTLPDWLMRIMNLASMAMTVYRMNKDDEYVDDDISEDIL